MNIKEINTSTEAPYARQRTRESAGFRPNPSLNAADLEERIQSLHAHNSLFSPTDPKSNSNNILPSIKTSDAQITNDPEKAKKDDEFELVELSRWSPSPFDGPLARWPSSPSKQLRRSPPKRSPLSLQEASLSAPSRSSETSPFLPGTPRLPRPLTNRGPTPTILSSLTMPTEEYQASNQQFMEWMKSINSPQKPILEDYKTIYHARNLQQRIENLKQKVESLPTSEEHEAILSDCTKKLSWIKNWRSQNTYIKVAKQRVRHQLHTPANHLGEEILLPPTDPQKGFELKLLRAESYLKISLLASDIRDSMESLKTTLPEETEQLQERIKQLKKSLKKNKSFLEQLPQQYISTINDACESLKDPQTVESGARSLLKLFMLDKRDSIEISNIWNAAHQVVKLADEIDERHHELKSLLQAFSRLIESLPESDRDLLTADLQYVFRNPISLAVDSIQNPHSPVQSIPWPIVSIAFEKFAERDFDDFAIQLSSHNLLACGRKSVLDFSTSNPD